MHRWDEALRWATAWVERHPDEWPSWFYRGQAYQLRRALKQAIADFQRVIELKPDHAEARLHLAGTYTLEGQFQLALTQYQAYLQSRPDDPDGLLGVANCHYSLGQYEAARSALDALLDRQDDHAAGLLLRAKVEIVTGSPADALKWLQRAETLAPAETDIVHTLALVARQLGQPEAAQKYEARLQELRQQIDRLETLRKQIQDEPENLTPRYEAGVTALRLRREEEAAEWFQSVLRLDPKHVPTHQALAEHFEAAGDRKRAAYHRKFLVDDGNR
jgi:tetratricopeptide (TPR) repeat protein